MSESGLGFGEEAAGIRINLRKQISPILSGNAFDTGEEYYSPESLAATMKEMLDNGRIIDYAKETNLYNALINRYGQDIQEYFNPNFDKNSNRGKDIKNKIRLQMERDAAGNPLLPDTYYSDLYYAQLARDVLNGTIQPNEENKERVEEALSRFSGASEYYNMNEVARNGDLGQSYYNKAMRGINKVLKDNLFYNTEVYRSPEALASIAKEVLAGTRTIGASEEDLYAQLTQAFPALSEVMSEEFDKNSEYGKSIIKDLNFEIDKIISGNPLMTKPIKAMSDYVALARDIMSGGAITYSNEDDVEAAYALFDGLQEYREALDSGVQGETKYQAIKKNLEYLLNYIETGDILAAKEDTFTQKQIAEAAKAVANGGSLSETDQTLANLIQSQYAEAITLKQMSPEELASDYGQALRKQLDDKIDINIDGIDSLVTLEQVSEAAAEAYKRLLTLTNSANRMPVVTSSVDSFVEQAKIIAAYNSIISGNASEEDYKAFASYTNTSVSYLKGRSNQQIQSAYGNAITAQQNLYQTDMNKIMSKMNFAERQAFGSALADRGLNYNGIVPMDFNNNAYGEAVRETANGYTSDARKRDLYSAYKLLQQSGSLSSFNNSLQNKGVYKDLLNSLSGDQTYLDLLTNGTKEDMEQYLFNQIFGFDNISEMMSNIGNLASSFVGSSEILSKSSGKKLTPEMKNTIAQAFNQTYESVDSMSDFWLQAYKNMMNTKADEIRQLIEKQLKVMLQNVGGMSADDIKNASINNKELTSLLSLAQAFGLDVGAGGKVTGNISIPKVNPLVATESIFTNRAVLTAAEDIRSSTDWKATAGEYSETMLNEIKSQYPELFKWLNMNPEQRGSKEGQVLLQEYEIKVKVSGLDDLVKLNEVSSEIASAIKSINESNYGVDASKNAFSGINELIDKSKGLRAYTRIISGQGIEEDYTNLASMLGIKDVSSLYRLGPEGIRRQYSKVYDEEYNRTISSANKLYKSMTPEQRLMLMQELSPYGFSGGGKRRGGISLSTDYISPEFGNALLNAENSYNPREDAIKALALVQNLTGIYGSNYDGLTSMISYAISHNKDYEAFNSYLTGNSNYMNALVNGDAGAIENLFSNLANGMNAYNPMTAYNNSTVLRFMNALLTQDKSILGEYNSEDSMLVEALNQYKSWNLYNKAMQGALTEEDIRSIRTEMAERYYTGLLGMNDGKYNESWIGQAHNLVGTETNRKSTLDTFTNDVLAIEKAMQDINSMNLDGTIDEEELGRLKSYGELAKLSAEEIAQLKPADIDKVRSGLQTTGTQMSDSIDAMIAQVQESGSSAADSIVVVLTMLKDALSGADAIADTTWTLDDLSRWANSASGYSSGITKNNRINQILALAQSSSSATEFLSNLEQAKTLEGNEWMADAAEFKSFVENSGLAQAFAMASSGNVSWDEILRNIEQASTYNGLMANTTYAGYMSQLDAFAGGNNFFMSQLANGTLDTSGFLDLLANPDNEGLKSWLQSLDGGSSILEALASGGERAAAAMKQLNSVLGSEGVKANKKYGDYTEDVVANLEGLSKNSKSALQTAGNIYKMTDGFYDQMTAIAKAKGKRGNQIDNQTLGVLSQALNIDQNSLKQKSKETIDQLLGSLEDAANEEYVGSIGETIKARLQDDINAALASGDITVDQLVKFDVNANGSFDLSEVLQIAQALHDEILANLAAYEGDVATLEAQYEKSGEGVLASLVLKQLSGGLKKGSTNGKYRGGGGGGGGGKSATDKLLQELKNRVTLADHRIKMTQLQEAQYEQMDQLGNVNNMLEYENTLQKEKAGVLEDVIQRLRNQMSTVEKNSDDWQKLYEAILQYEEQLDQTNNTIYANSKKINENKKAIHQATVELQQYVDQVQREIIQRERDMLQATVQMQETILEAIKQRHQDEWDLIEKGVEKEKEALEKKKSLINEELQKRKQASEEGKKAEELAEYQRQLALISMDPTRNKEAKELQKKIDDLNEERAWTIAEREAESSTQELDDQISAMDEYLEHGREDLEYLLQDANNFAIEVAEILTGSQAQIIEWLQKNVKQYTWSLDEAKKNMVLEWEDTYKAMKGIFDKFIDEIAKAMSSKEAFLELVKQSNEYLQAPTPEAEELILWNKGDEYDKAQEMKKNEARYAHSDPGIDGNFTGTTTTTTTTTTPKTNPKKDPKDDGKKSGALVIDLTGKSNNSLMRTIAQKNVTLSGDGLLNSTRSSAIGSLNYKPVSVSTIKTGNNAKGGLIDYTGIAWVDGTKANPEAFLSSKDRGLMRDLLDSGVMQGVRDMMKAFSRISVNTTMPNIFSGSANADTKVSIGDINIHTEHINDQLDIENLATKIGEEFVKQLTASGIQTTRLAW